MRHFSNTLAGISGRFVIAKWGNLCYEFQIPSVDSLGFQFGFVPTKLIQSKKL